MTSVLTPMRSRLWLWQRTTSGAKRPTQDELSSVTSEWEVMYEL